MRQGKWAILCWVLVSCFFMAGGAVFAAEPIATGAIASLTGYLSDQAQNVVEGMELGIEEINGKGGVLGRQLKVYARDDEITPPVGARRFEDLVKNEKIDAALVIALLPIAVILWYSLPISLQRFLSPELTSDIRPVMEYIGEHRRDGDVLYFYYSSAPAFLYYAPLYDLESGNIQIQPEEIRKKIALQDFFEGVESLAGYETVSGLYFLISLIARAVKGTRGITLSIL